MCICGPTTQVSASVHFWADAHGWRDTEGELEGQEKGGEGKRDSIHLLALFND